MTTEQGWAVATIVMSVLGPLCGTFAGWKLGRKDQLSDLAREALFEAYKAIQEWQRAMAEVGWNARQDGELWRFPVECGDKVMQSLYQIEASAVLLKMTLGKVGDDLAKELLANTIGSDCVRLLRSEGGVEEYLQAVNDKSSKATMKILSVSRRVMGATHDHFDV